MQQTIKQPLHKGIILRTTIIFLASYFISLIIWIQVKDIYTHGIINAASHLITLLNDVKLEELTYNGDETIEAVFSPLRRNAGILMNIPINTSALTFNVPLTFAIMAALSPFVRKRAYIEGLCILFGTHILTIFFNEAAQLTVAFVQKGFSSAGAVRIAVYQFLWVFTAKMVIKFIPFLIGLYMFIRFRK